MVTENGEFTALGLPLRSDDENYDIAAPLEAIVVVKGLDSQDKTAYWVFKTPDLLNVEARGMLDWAMEVTRSS